MRLIDLTGATFGRLTVVSRSKHKRAGGRHVAWDCRCQCGAATVVTTVHLRSGHTLSCGCFRRDETSRRFMTHGHSARTLRPERITPEYRAWCGAKSRCYRKTSPDYADYGARGIRMDERWRSDFRAFYADMGPRPKGMSLDRIDPDGNYEPGNCRWATLVQQANNKRSLKRYDYGGDRLTLGEIAARAGVNYRRLRKLLRPGRRTAEEAVAYVLANPITRA